LTTIDNKFINNSIKEISMILLLQQLWLTFMSKLVEHLITKLNKKEEMDMVFFSLTF